MEKDLRLGKKIKYINYNGDYLCFNFDESDRFKVVFYESENNTKIDFYGEFDKILDTANELIFKYKLQICL